MKGKFIIAFCCLGLLLLFVLLKNVFTCKITENLVIAKPIEEVAIQFTDLKNWPNWFPALADQDPNSIHFSETTDQVNSFIETSNGQSFRFTAVSPAGIVFRKSFKNKTRYQSLVAVSDSSGRTSSVTSIRYLNVWEWLMEKISSPDTLSAKLLPALKHFEENPLTYYGFPIEIRPVSDSLIMTGQIMAPPKAVNQIYHQLDRDLTTYAREQKLVFKSYRFMSLKPADSGKIRVAVGLVVNKRGPVNKQIKFLELPAHGRLLIGNTTGNAGKIRDLYAAMEKYMKEHNLNRVADPLEKYEQFPQNAEDSMHITVEIQIPIY